VVGREESFFELTSAAPVARRCSGKDGPFPGERDRYRAFLLATSIRNSDVIGSKSGVGYDVFNARWICIDTYRLVMR